MPLPLGEVAEQSEVGEGNTCPCHPEITSLPSRSPSVTALPKGEPSFLFLPISHKKRKTNNPVDCWSLCWRYLSSRPVTRQVLSARVCLTSVFGMGTGGPTPQSTPTSRRNKLHIARLGLKPKAHPLRCFSSQNHNHLRWVAILYFRDFLYTLKTEHEIPFLHLTRGFLESAFTPIVGQALGLLVSVSYTHYCASTPDLSTT